MTELKKHVRTAEERAGDDEGWTVRRRIRKKEAKDGEGDRKGTAKQSVVTK